MDAERLFTETKQGFDFYHRPSACGTRSASTTSCSCRSSTRARWRTPARDVPARTTSSGQPGHPLHLRAARRDRAARDGAHVVRRPGHHALVGRPVAQRVVRHLGVGALPGGGHRVHRGLDDVRQRREVWAYRQDQLPSTHPIAADIPDLQAVEVNFDGITYAKGASVLKQLVAYVGLEEFLAGLRAYFAAPRLGQRHVRRPARRAGGGLGRDLSGLGRAVAADHRAEPAAARRSTSTTTARSPGSTVVQGGARPGAGELRTHRLAVGVYDDDGAAASWSAPTASSSTSTGERTEVPELVGVAARQARAGQRRRPHLLRAAARPGLAGHARSTGSATSPSRCRARCAGRRRGR